MFRTFFVWVQKYERRLSAVAMILGFIFDTVLFGRIDVLRTQIIFAIYTLACFISIPLYHFLHSYAERRNKPAKRFWAILPLVTQFALGGFWSGFLIFYTRAASVAASWPFLLILLAIFIGNEYFRKYHSRLVFTSILFFFALYSYTIFLVPIYTGTIGTLTFLESGALAVIVFFLFTRILRVLGRARFLADVKRIRIGALSVLVLINFFYFTNILPPLPLSAKAAGIYHAVWRVPGAYMANAEEEPWQARYLGFAPTFHVVAGESLYAYSAVFAPTKLTTTIIHQWQWYDPQAKQWVTKAAISYPIVGGNDGGYRGYSAVYMSTAGTWRVNIETADGRIIARLPFTVDTVQLPSPQETITLP